MAAIQTPQQRFQGEIKAYKILVGRGGITTAAGILLGSVADALTAHSGGGQANALPLTAEVNRVSVAAATGDSVRLPAAVAGALVEIINDGASTVRVFGAGIDTIDGVATATGVPMASGLRAIFRCVVSSNATGPVAGTWYSMGAVKVA